MDIKKTTKNFIGVVFSNFSTILAGVVIGFAIPKMMSVHDYGMLKTFTLYVSYLGLFSFGIVDGIVLEYGGNDYDELDRPKFRNYFKWFLLVNLLSSFFIILLSVILFKNDQRFIFVAIAINLVMVNISSYFQQLSQITQRFKEYSLRKIIQSILNILLVLLCFSIYKNINNIDYRLYVILLLLINVFLSLWYINTYKEIVFGDSLSLFETRSDIKYLMTIGIPLLIANICSVLIVTLDSQFVNILFPTAEYAMYAFAYNLLSLITIATAAISTILYPILKRTDAVSMKQNYGFLISSIVIVIFAALIIYYPLYLFVEWYLPNYIASLIIFKIIFPGVALTTPIVVVMHNYYKALKKSNEYFKISLKIILFSIIANFIAYYLFKTTVAISYASIIVLFIWFIYVENKFVIEYNYSRYKNLSYIIIMILSFYICSSIQQIILGCMIYIFLYIVLTLIYFKDQIKNLKFKFNKK
ncbi:oligosaccharide flippase family protein [Lactococcus lactis]|uniref:oligosaccharide flippase family protein n=1 Tax=Lactococcus lactis TaxID=1358 RepID=UPI003DA9125D